MRLTNFGVFEVACLKEVMKLDIFVENGSFTGGIANAMSDEFKKVYTIEKLD